VWLRRGFVLTLDGALSGTRAPVSAVGVANLCLWLLASGDRVILAHWSLSSLAVYAALYGLLDRLFRTVSNAEIQQRLPLAFAAPGAGRELQLVTSARAVGVLVLAAGVAGLLAPTTVSVVSGGAYHPELWMSLTLSAAMATMLAAVPAYVVLVARGRGAVLAAIAAAAAVVNIVGNVLLASRFGTTSAALLTLAGYAIWLVGVYVAALRRADQQEPLNRSVAQPG
jgi:O-antigen/teichoic acid export membrane protein